MARPLRDVLVATGCPAANDYLTSGRAALVAEARYDLFRLTRAERDAAWDTAHSALRTARTQDVRAAEAVDIEIDAHQADMTDPPQRWLRLREHVPSWLLWN
ncbi:hypothetical protein GCM10010466_39180 [Planomonospora alba]|uniref:Uncharacterized protein n=1 Tax=Planomonospora alba TaxID=161354 RepID=A0ABP6ND04_9ACTN